MGPKMAASWYVQDVAISARLTPDLVGPGEKGSDASAREAARRLLALQRQLSALTLLMDTLNVTPVPAPHIGGGTAQDRAPQPSRVQAGSPRTIAIKHAAWAPLNTVVRGVFKELQNINRGV